MYYVAAYSTTLPMDRQVVPYSQYMAWLEGGREPKQDDALVQQRPPPPLGDEGEVES